jgi:hypothetical protein
VGRGRRVRFRRRVGGTLTRPGVFPFGPVDAQVAHLSSRDVAELIGCESSCVRHWRRGARLLTVAKADAFACALGLHPLLLWPDFAETGLES